ncbi:MAG: PAS domain S-box protein [Desulfohalobiaceae bacterium]|nr:PAS domain S-box protein [Desulfohalobiaceae bacterium]
MKFNNIPDKVLESMQEQVYVRDLDMNIQYLNPAAEQLTGCSLQDALGRKCYELFSDAAQNCRMNCPVDKAIAEELPLLHHEGRLKDKTGAEREMRVSISPVYDQKDVTSAVVVMQDLSLPREQERLQAKTLMALDSKIEELEQTKNRLERTQQELTTVLDASPALIWQKDSQGRYLQVNRKYCETVGLSYQEVIGKTDFELFPEEIARRYRDGDRASLAKGESEHGIIEQHVKPSGDFGWSRTDKIVWRDGAEGISGTIGFALDITEQKQIEMALQGERDLVERIMDTSPAGITVVSREGRVVYANRRAKSILGLQLSETAGPLYNDPVWKITDFDGNPFPENQLPFSLVQKTGKPVSNVRHAIEWPDGRRVLLSISAAPLLDTNEVFDGMVSTLEDITEKERMEQDYRMLFQEMIDGFALHEIVTDEKGNPVDYRFLAVNPAFELLTGFKAEALIGKTALEIMPAIEPEWIEKYGHVALTGEPATFEGYSQVIGRFFYVRAFSPVKHQFACIFMDITLRKRVERENRINRLRLEIVHHLAGMPEATEQEVFDYVLERMLELSDSPIGFLGFLTPDEQVMQIHAWSDQAMAQCGVQDHPLTFPIAEAGIWGEPVRTRKPCIINAYTEDHPAKKGCPEGHVHISRFMGVPVFDGERLVALAAVGNKEALYEDIDARQMMLLLENCWDQIRRRRYEREKLALEKQLQQAQKMEAIGTLAGGIAHDFNNILYPLMGFTELLKEDVSADSPLHSHIDEILQASMRARDLVKQILAFSRQGEQEYKPIRLQPILKEALKLLRASLPAKIDIQQDIQADCGLVVADPTQIHQILMNLATNAYQAMEARGGRLMVGLEQIRMEPDPKLQPDFAPGVYVRLSVEDTGSGIEQHVLDKIFEPYFTTKETGKGTGLGLSVVQGIVKKSNGDIQITSTPGQGTEIRVYFPVLENTSLERQTDPDLPVLGGTESLLLVDDELAIVKMEQQILERLGYRVTVSTGSVEALEAFRADPYAVDLVITDMSMPNMSGLQLSTELKRIRPDIPVVLCTGFSDQINAEKSKALGIDGFVLKPVVRQEIAALLRKVLQKEI